MGTLFFRMYLCEEHSSSGTILLLSCENGETLHSCDNCYVGKRWTHDDMDGLCHSKKTKSGKTIGYKHVCVDNEYYRTEYETVKCGDVNGDYCWCFGKQREYGEDQGCFVS